MKIISWNVNGLRAVHRNGFWEDFMSLKGDIICLQETKMEKEQMPYETREMPGYISLWNSSKKRKGYSGTAIYIAKQYADKIKEVHYGLGNKEYDGEGRLITVIFDDFVVCNGYFPNGGMGPDRLSFKMGYYGTFMSFMENVRKKHSNGHVLWMGDVNTAHNEIDLARPKANEKNTGFLPIEREWIDEVEALGYIDSYRYFNPNKEGAYSWWDAKTRSRGRNVGWRIDYIFVSEELLPKVKKAQIHSSVFGSDHCPISVDVEI
ncbi:MAG: exodeoxyribonuclease III [Candidatus Pacebacteria bacterium]|nr:exodeoxyribonuclease III [Candidatus Paceibacterota bacterium]